MENTENLSPSETEILPESTPSIQPEIKPKGKFVKLPIIILSLITLIFFGLIAYLLIKQQNDKKVKDSADIETEVEETSDEQDEDIEDETVDDESEGVTEEDELNPGEPSGTDKNRIVYIKDYNIWVMNSDGSGKIQITNDASELIQYRAIDWKESGIISYSRCDGECAIYTYDLKLSSETPVFTGIPFTQSFDAIEWSHDGTLLAYIFTKGDFSKEASIWNGTDTIVLVSYAPPPGRGGHYDDGMEIEFSPDDMKLVVLNTAIDETFNKPIMAFSTDGTVLVELEGATFPTFYGNGGFYYKHDGLIKRWNLLTSISSTVTFVPTASIHNLQTSPDGYFISFWSDISSSDLKMNYYDTGGSSSVIADNFVKPKWLDDNSEYLVAIKVTDIGVMGMYESGGLSRVKRTNGTTIDLDAGSIYTFEVE